jgi:hypothetical protein
MIMIKKDLSINACASYPSPQKSPAKARLSMFAIVKN